MGINLQRSGKQTYSDKPDLSASTEFCGNAMLHTRETPTDEDKYLEQTFYLSMLVLTTF